MHRVPTFHHSSVFQRVEKVLQNKKSMSVFRDKVTEKSLLSKRISVKENCDAYLVTNRAVVSHGVLDTQVIVAQTSRITRACELIERFLLVNERNCLSIT